MDDLKLFLEVHPNHIETARYFVKRIQNASDQELEFDMFFLESSANQIFLREYELFDRLPKEGQLKLRDTARMDKINSGRDFDYFEIDNPLVNIIRNNQKIPQELINQSITNLCENISPFSEANLSSQFIEKLKDPDYVHFLKPYLEGKNVIELGPGYNPIVKQLFNYFSISQYIGVDRFSKEEASKKIKKMKNVYMNDSDALTYIKGKKDVNIISFGLLCPEIAKYKANDYFRILAKAIYDATPVGGISIHSVTRADQKRLLLDAGFKEHGDSLKTFVYCKQ